MFTQFLGKRFTELQFGERAAVSRFVQAGRLAVVAGVVVRSF
jgi:hypothetical protein